MSEIRVASRYAKSLITLAQEKGELASIHEDMQLFAVICEENRDFELMLKNPIINHDKKLAILKELFDDKVNETTLSFFEIIARKNRERVLPLIAKEFHIQYNALKGVEMATVKTIHSLNDEQRSRFKSAIVEATGMNSVELTEVIDNELIGGYILKIGGKQIDESLKGKLKELQLEFAQNPYVKGF
ncbi:MAG: ATP synthase F1 subunit delta [Cyclobacteriaceae bacterium]|nr:ATP synthase F1 subunit delta [Cyclobacteriaceae bacterium]